MFKSMQRMSKDGAKVSLREWTIKQFLLISQIHSIAVSQKTTRPNFCLRLTVLFNFVPCCKSNPVSQFSRFVERFRSNHPSGYIRR